MRQGGVAGDANVVSFTTTIIAEGVGLLGQLARIELTYETPAPDDPKSLIAKFPAASEENRNISNLFRFYERETRFYEDVAPSTTLRSARCYYSALEPESLDFVLLLEDLSSARCGDQIRGATREEAELAIRELARFQVAWWATPRLEQLEWLPDANAPIQRSAETSYQQAWEPLLKNFGTRLPASVVKTGDRLQTQVFNLLEMLAEPPRTYIHGDYHVENLFFDLPDGESPLAVIDWQISSRGRAAYDIGYFMTQSVETPVRRATEKHILRMYHNVLMENGIHDYSYDQLFHDYRVAALFCFVYPVVSGGSLDLSNERGVALVTARLDRNAAAIVDLNCADILPA